MSSLPSVRDLFPTLFPGQSRSLQALQQWPTYEPAIPSPSWMNIPPSPSSTCSSRSSSPQLSQSSSAASTPISLPPIRLPRVNNALDSSPKPRRRKYVPPRKYPCNVCDMKFARPCELKVHENKHTGARPHTCPLCPRRFSTSSNVARHLRTLHNDQSRSVTVRLSPFSGSDASMLSPPLLNMEVDEDMSVPSSHSSWSADSY